ncbi:MAG TPA: hypothetical protein VJH20_01195 [Candidatus Nanoarchaeia archaeon]|nr:hypothetical protein [Candidatus Nanoarchaeia archaeon]
MSDGDEPNWYDDRGRSELVSITPNRKNEVGKSEAKGFAELFYNVTLGHPAQKVAVGAVTLIGSYLSYKLYGATGLAYGIPLSGLVGILASVIGKEYVESLEAEINDDHFF